ncbi:MAG: non-ribosomal peptide synthetase, partial [Planctomycetota bacterium]
MTGSQDRRADGPQAPEDLDALTPEQRRALLGQLLARRKAARQERPVSFAQRRLWFLDRLVEDGSFYNTAVALRLDGALNRDALGRSLDAVLARHEVLRTTYAVRDGEPRQVVSPPAPLGLSLVDLSTLEGEEQELALRRTAKQHTASPFDLERGPVLRVSLVQLGPERHALLMVVHHIAYDGWSNDVFLSELLTGYEAFVAGREPQLAPLPLQYGDWAALQQRELEGEALAAHLDHSKARLAGAAALELPTDRSRPPRQRFDAARCEALLPGRITEGLLAAGRAQRATLFMTGLAALNVLLMRLSGQEDIVLGTPVAGRSDERTESLIGCFINSVVLRSDLSGDPSFAELLGAVREQALDAFDHAALPFERLVEELLPERDLSRNPIFNVLFMQQGGGGATAAPRSAAGLTFRPLGMESGTTRLDLEVYVFAGDDGLRVVFNYSTALFDAATIERMLGQYTRLLEAVAEDADRPISQLPLQSAEDAALVAQIGCGRTSALPEGACVHDLVAAQCARTPEAVAACCGDEQLTYAELLSRADGVAARLTALGLGPGDLVGLYVERGLPMLCALLGVARAGAAYVPLDPGFPSERLAFMAQDAGLAAVITTERDPGALAEGVPHVLTLDAQAAVLPVAHADPQAAAAPTPRRAVPDDLAYVLYTSGSTGRPKGVAVPHRAVVNLLQSMAREPGLQASDVFAALTTLSFDISVLELLAPLLVGARVLIVSRDVAVDGERLSALLSSSGATVAQATPATWRLLLESGWEGSDGFAALVGGEAWGWDLAEPLLARCAAVWNMYGPTETTVWSAVRRLQPGDGRVVVGGPIANTTLVVRDAQGEPVPLGVPGELCIGGLGLAREYLGRPQLTAERFVAAPLPDDPDARLYRTGDRVRWLADGSLQFLGRLDGQIKLRGFRIELGEIESVLARHPSLSQAAVSVHTPSAGEPRLVAYMLAAPGAVPDAAELAAHLRAQLPDYMVPSLFVTLEQLPRTPNGKLDRAALPAPDAGASAGLTAWVAPEGAVQTLLAELWAAVLGADRVGARDDFFASGGHSLLAMRLVSRIRDAFGVELPLADAFRVPVLADQAECVQALRQGDALAQPPALVPVARDGVLPLSFQQQRLWFLDQLEPGSAAYNMTVARRLVGSLDVDALRAALSALAQRHEALRTSFPAVDGEAHLCIASEGELPLHEEDLSAAPDDERRALSIERVAALGAEPLDLAKGPVARAALLRLAPDEHVLLLVVHHIVSDAWSMNVVWADLAASYTAACAGETAQLPPLPLGYADFAHWQRSWFSGEVLERELSWWRDTLGGGAPGLDLPTDHPRPRTRRSLGASESLVVDAETLLGLRELGRREGASQFMVLLAAFKLLLMRASGSEDVVIGTPIAGRDHTSVEGLMGFFINTLVVRSDLSGAPSFRELLARVRQSTLNAFGHQSIPFEQLVDALQPERDLSRNPLFDVFVNMIEVPEEGPGKLGGLTVESAPGAREVAKFDLTLYLFVRGDELTVRLNYDADLFEAGTAAALLRQYSTLLSAVGSQAEQSITSLPLLDDDERARAAAQRGGDVLTSAFTAFGPEAVESSVAQRFFDMAAQHAERPAVVTESDSCSYAELESSVRAVAQGLLELAAASPAAGRAVEPVAGASSEPTSEPMSEPMSEPTADSTCDAGAAGEATSARSAGAGSSPADDWPPRVALLLGPGAAQCAAVLGVLASGQAYV